MKEIQGKALPGRCMFVSVCVSVGVRVCVCKWMCLYNYWCVSEPGRHCARWGVKVRSLKGWTSLHQQCLEALSLSRYTSLLGNVISLQNKHTLTSSALTHGPQPSGAKHDEKKKNRPRKDGCKFDTVMAAMKYHSWGSEPAEILD